MRITLDYGKTGLIGAVPLMFALSLVGCSQADPSPPTRQAVQAAPVANPKPNQARGAIPIARKPSAKEMEALIPADVSYSVTEADVVPGRKRSLDVLLSRKVSEQVLRAIALKLRAEGRAKYDRTFICFYLPGMKVDSGAWATTHFTPNLDVRILGMPAEGEHPPSSQSSKPEIDVIGSWLKETGVAERISIFRRRGKTFAVEKFKDGSGSTTELIETATPKGTKFQRRDNPANLKAKSHWLLDLSGNLEFSDDDGVYATARKVPDK